MRGFDLPRSDVSMQLDMGLLSCRLTKTARDSLGEHREIVPMGDTEWRLRDEEKSREAALLPGKRREERGDEVDVVSCIMLSPH